MNMTGREITALAARIFAIIVIVQAALLGSMVAAGASIVLGSDDVGIGNIIYIAGVAVSVLAVIAIGVLLWRFSSKTLLASEGCESSGDAKELEPVILSALGIYFIVRGLISLGQTAGAYLMVAAETEYFQFKIGSIIPVLFQILVGALLVVRPHTWAALLRRLREARY